MKTKASVGIDNQTSAGANNSVGAPGGTPQGRAATQGDNILDRSTTGAASGGISNDNQTLTSNDRAPQGQGPSGLLGVEQAYAKPTDASTPAALVGDLPR